MLKSPMITQDFFSLFIISIKSYNVDVNISRSAFGWVFGLYIVPMMLFLQAFEFEITSMKTDSNT